MTVNAALLDKALRDLRQSWATTDTAWRDQARRDFQEQHLERIEARTREGIKAIAALDTLIRTAVQQCG